MLLTDVTWDNYNGEYSFAKSAPHTSKNIYERKDIKVADLVIYSYPDANYPTYKFHNVDKQGIEYTEELNEYMYLSKLIGGPETGPDLSYLDADGNCLCNRVEEMDNLWELLRMQLNNLIKNGNLESLQSATDEQLSKLIGN